MLHPVSLKAGAGQMPARTGAARRGAEGGFTLIELLISLVLSSLLFSSMIVVFSTQNRINTVETDVVEIQQNARVALNALAQDVRQAGYFTDQFNRQPIWLDAAPYQLTFNANLSNQFVAMHRDSAVPLSDGTMYNPGDFTAPPQSEGLPAFLDRYLNESETVRFTLDVTYDGLITAADRQRGSPNPFVYTLMKEINGNPPAILGYNIRGPEAYPDATRPQPLFQYWGTFVDDDLDLWGDTNGNGRLEQSEITALTPVSRVQLVNIRQVDLFITAETSRPDSRMRGGVGSSPGNDYPYRSYDLLQRVRPRNVGINPLGLVLCGQPPSSPLNPSGYDTPTDQGGSITLEWDAAMEEYDGELDVQFYSVYRRLGSGDYNIVGQVQAVGTDTSYVFVDNGDIDNFDAPVDGEEYYYYISAWDCAPQESNPSAVIGPIVSIANGPQPPTITDGWDEPCDTGRQITLQFTRSPQDDGTGTGVGYYQIYRGQVADSSIVSKVLIDTTFVATGAATYHYTDNSGNAVSSAPVDHTRYWYIIRAIQGEVSSENSNEFGEVWSDNDVSAPRITLIEDKPADDGTALLVNFRKSMTEDCSPPVTEYRIYRRVKGISSWTLAGTMSADGSQNYLFESTGLTTLVTYEYTVHGVGDDVSESIIREGTPLTNPPVGPPSNLDAVDVACDSDGDIQVQWVASPDDGAGSANVDDYHIYRRIDTGSYALIATITADGSASYVWLDNAENDQGAGPPAVGNTYWYKVAAYDSDTSSESEFSNEDSAMADGTPGAPDVTAAFDLFAGGARQIRVEFTASADDGGCSDTVTHYRIYRTTTAGDYSGGYVQVVAATDLDAYQVIDSASSYPGPGPTSDGIYWYTVTAWDETNGVESAFAAEFGPVEPYGANCDCCPIFTDDMESGSNGWTHDASPGYRDEWDRGDPDGDSFDPNLAHSGSSIWGIDLGNGYRDGQYRSNTDSWLISPDIDLSGFLDGYVTFSYWRWLSVERSTRDRARIRIRNEDTGWVTIWQNDSASNTVDTEWRLQKFDISQWALGKERVQIQFMLETNGSQQFGGWNVDDVEVCYTAPTSCDYFSYVEDSVSETGNNNVYFELENEDEVAIQLLGMEIEWTEVGSRLKTIYNQDAGGAQIWTTGTAQLSPVTATFGSPVSFSGGEQIRFRFLFQPGDMEGTSIVVRLITSCGTSGPIIFYVPE